jgi:hypothetical protein
MPTAVSRKPDAAELTERGQQELDEVRGWFFTFLRTALAGWQPAEVGTDKAHSAGCGFPQAPSVSTKRTAEPRAPIRTVNRHGVKEI